MSSIKRRWLKISRGSGKKAAAVAIARQLLVALWQMVRQQTPYRPHEPEPRRRKPNQEE